MNEKENLVLSSADILVPKAGTDMKKWSVVACDQYTSELEYWEQVKAYVGDEESALNLIFPEIYLEDGRSEERIKAISQSMKSYLKKDIFQKYENAYVYVERTLENKQVRHGIVGKIDLECYDYTKGAKLSVRATEGTVLDRIPPRVKVREQCPIELPHVMILIDDEAGYVIEEITKERASLTSIYDFDLMQNSGSIQGYLLNETCKEILNKGIEKLMDPEAFNQKYGTKEEAVLLFAVGDGNHSLATAKKCYENLKLEIGEKALESPARYALVELVNLHDKSLEFEAIHRVVVQVDPQHMIEKLGNQFQKQDSNKLEDSDFVMVYKGSHYGYGITNPTSNLAVGDLQKFLDDYIEEYGGSVDYIHGEQVVDKLCGTETEGVGFLLNCMDKSQLYKTVILDGALPRKTFSMGEACDKRFYLEAREIMDLY